MEASNPGAALYRHRELSIWFEARPRGSSWILSGHENVDQRFAAAQTGDDTGARTRRKPFEGRARRLGVAVDDDADAREVLLLVLTHHGRSVPRPQARMQVAHGVSRWMAELERRRSRRPYETLAPRPRAGVAGSAAS